MRLFPSSGVEDNSPCRLGRGVLVCQRNVDAPHVTQTEDSKGFKLLGNFMSGRETGALINTCEAPYLLERDLASAPFGIQGHRNTSGIQELLSHVPCATVHTCARSCRRPYIALHIQAAYHHWVWGIPRKQRGDF